MKINSRIDALFTFSDAPEAEMVPIDEDKFGLTVASSNEAASVSAYWR